MRFMFSSEDLPVEITLLPSFLYRGGCHVHAEANVVGMRTVRAGRKLDKDSY